MSGYKRSNVRLVILSSNLASGRMELMRFITCLQRIITSLISGIRCELRQNSGPRSVFCLCGNEELKLRHVTAELFKSWTKKEAHHKEMIVCGKLPDSRVISIYPHGDRDAYMAIHTRSPSHSLASHLIECNR